LKSTAKIFNLNLSEQQMNKLNEARLNLRPFPDSEKGLEKLSEATRRRTEVGGKEVAVTDEAHFVLLSNGEANRSSTILSNSGLRKFFDYVIGAEEVRKYKLSAEPYLLVSRKLNLHISQIALVSSNFWDIAGAKSVGMQTCWINREGKKANEEINIKSDYIFSSVEDMADNLSEA
jgi:2-haloacid dehalogenase